MLFLTNYKVFDNKRSDDFTFFASMDEKAEEAEQGPNIRQHGRWNDAGHAYGWAIVEAPDAKTLAAWVFNWPEYWVDVDIEPICDDNVAREIILKTKPSWMVSYDTEGDKAMEGESLYKTYGTIYLEHMMDVYTRFENLTEDEAKADRGSCRLLGRFHDLGSGSGVAIYAARTEKDIYAHMFNWAALMDIKVVPVVTDKEFKDVVKAKPEQKLTARKAKMGAM